ADRNRSHWSTSKTPSYTKSVSWQHHRHRDIPGMKFKLKLTYSAWRILGSGHYDIRLFFVKLRKIYGEKSRSIEPLFT
ncbi:hypothetical protein, partial [Salmonella enterica]